MNALQVDYVQAFLATLPCLAFVVLVVLVIAFFWGSDITDKSERKEEQPPLTESEDK